MSSELSHRSCPHCETPYNHGDVVDDCCEGARLAALEDRVARVAHTLLAYDHAPMADKPTYRAELIEQVRVLVESLGDA